ncbi:cleavage and polyadenylation specificity factor subunit 6 [Eurytemora carolleeae]|uniref:cleavage and polyadenylation specificity factor subunit 6 n=1 Tax=Eurytemora carolleeae TaxID=1294199 RepID=UPI000C7807DA|nr:cleavage and polyadenylation specificity factor subunit 6 [Eurytemora carolleeae]|eukprot:XP_023330789.1 cleavage and polyadenylation specificity factor subunit 6-like [Eurytemora affinis]
MHPPASRQYSPGSDNPPPLPPPRGSHNPPPTPPRGTTPPPPLPPHSANNMNGVLPPLYRRMSPVPGPGPGRPLSGARGTSPVARQTPLLIPNNLEVHQQVEN